MMKSAAGKREVFAALASAAVVWLLVASRKRLPTPAHRACAETAAPPATPDRPAHLAQTRAAVAGQGSTPVQPIWKAYFSLMVSAARAWSSHRAASKGAALALYTLFSLAPMLLLVVALAGFFFGTDQVSRALLEQMQSLMGKQGAEVVATMLSHENDPEDGILASIVSIVLLLVGATSAFAELKDSLDELWDIPRDESEGLWVLVRDRFLSFGLILVLVLMLMASLTVSAALTALGSLIVGMASTSSFQLISQAVSAVITFLIVSGLFAAIFKYLPATPVAWKDVLTGALITAVLFTVGKLLIGLYLGHGGVSTRYGAAASLVVLISWIYYSAQIFFYGALFTHEYAIRFGSHAPHPA